jgi:RsiW-degrading membrane proteinase PrsW (M82 family)
LNSQFHSILENINQIKSGIGELEQIQLDMMKQPIISAAVFLILGLIAPLIEEIFKPMSSWFILSRPLEEFEGFSLGLISGGAFTILESAGIVIQMGSQDWLIAIALRTATGVLHIGLSGLVGYGLARSWRQKQFGRGLLYIIAATILHGIWNSMALLSGFSSSVFNRPEMETSGTSGVISLIFLMVIFISVVAITLKINSVLRQDLARPTEPSH